MCARGYTTIRTCSAVHGPRSFRNALSNPRAAVRFLPTLGFKAEVDKFPCIDWWAFMRQSRTAGPQPEFSQHSQEQNLQSNGSKRARPDSPAMLKPLINGIKLK